MQLGTINNPRKDIFKEMNFIAKNSFDFIDLTLEPPYGNTYDPIKIKDKLIELNLDIVGHSNPTLPAIYGISSIRKDCIEELKKSAIFFKQVGASKMNIHPFYYASHLNDEEIFKHNVKLIKVMADYCRDLGLLLMLENFDEPFHNSEAFERLFNEIPNLNVHLDIGHLNIFCDSALMTKDFFERFGNKIIHMHVHDNFGEEDNHLPIGCGDIHWNDVLSTIKEAGYDDTISLEVFSYDRDYLLISQEKFRKMWGKVEGK